MNRRRSTIGIGNYVSQVTRMTDLVLRSSVCHVVRVEMWSYKNLNEKIPSIQKKEKQANHKKNWYEMKSIYMNLLRCTHLLCHQTHAVKQT